MPRAMATAVVRDEVPHTAAQTNSASLPRMFSPMIEEAINAVRTFISQPAVKGIRLVCGKFCICELPKCEEEAIQWYDMQKC